MIGQIVNFTYEFAVQPISAVCFRTVKRGDTHFDERVREIFTDDLFLIFCSGVCTFRRCESETHLTEVAQHTDTVLIQQHG